MSHLIQAVAPLPTLAAGPIPLLQAVSEAVAKVEGYAEEHGLKPIWSQAALETEIHHVDEATFADDSQQTEARRVKLSVLAAHPKEITP